MTLLTKTPLLYLFCGQGKDRQYLNHNLHNYAHYTIRDWHLGINIQAFKEIPGALKKVDKGVIAGTNTDGRLKRRTSESLGGARREDTYDEENINANKDCFS
jgi:hypothetical protein